MATHAHMTTFSGIPPKISFLQTAATHLWSTEKKMQTGHMHAMTCKPAHSLLYPTGNIYYWPDQQYKLLPLPLVTLGVQQRNQRDGDINTTWLSPRIFIERKRTSQTLVLADKDDFLHTYQSGSSMTNPGAALYQSFDHITPHRPNKYPPDAGAACRDQ